MDEVVHTMTSIEAACKFVRHHLTGPFRHLVQI
jgi:hypothetical protein